MRPLSALTLTVSGRRVEEEDDENDTVFCLLAAEDDEADADAEDWPESVRETGSVVMAVVGAALGVVIVIPGLARMVVEAVAAAAALRAVVALSCCCAVVSDGRVGSGGGGIVS